MALSMLWRRGLRLTIFMAFGGVELGAAQEGNLLANGTFETLEAWTANENLRKNGQTTLLPEEQGVMLHNPDIALDGSLYQDVAAGGHEWFAWSVRIRGGGQMYGMVRASLAFVSLGENGETLDIKTPTKISGSNWTTYHGVLRVPPGTARVRTLLSVLDGRCSFANVELRKTEPPKPVAPKSRLTPGQGFSVAELPAERPFWELFCDDLDGDGEPEIAGCDVEGVVTVRKPGAAPFLAFDAGALVYQFAAADLNGDGKKEILMTSVDPKIPLRAIDLKGTVVLTIGESCGPERLAVCDMDGDGVQEIAASVGNGVPGSGVAAGVALFDALGRKLWEKSETIRTFRFADRPDGAGKELLVGGPRVEFRSYDKGGSKIGEIPQLQGGLLEQFEARDIDGDGMREIVLSVDTGLICLRGNQKVWEAPISKALWGAGALHACGDFDPRAPGLETILVGTHGIAMFDAYGVMIYQSQTGPAGEYWEKWAPGGINCLDIACWDSPRPQLYLSSSRFRHAAYYRLDFGGPDEFADYRVPDLEAHLEDIYTALKRQSALPARNAEKVKVFMAAGDFARVPEETLREYRKALDALESPSLEYLVMYEASDLLGHERGQKMTTEQIVARAALFEKIGIPFGYFATHGGQVWISWEAIRRSKEAAPTMFRFVYIAENLETLYSPLYTDVLKWTDEMLDFCADHGMKMIFKEKHDVWGLLPADSEVSDILFSPRHRGVAVPIWSTNQPYQPEIQLGGMLGLKLAGYCQEFGMSTQYWNWHEWGRYPRGIRDISATFVCPSDIMLRLELTGLALGATWIHIEGGQPYLRADLRDGIAPTALRHRELAYELIRKNIIAPGAAPANVNRAVIVRSFHPALEEGKNQKRRVAYPYYDRNTEALRKGFIPARYLFETYPKHALPWLAYAMDWNVRTCYPKTPNGWLCVLPPEAQLQADQLPIETDGERVMMAGQWASAQDAARTVAETIARGADSIPIQAPGACMILQQAEAGSYVAVLIDPGYLAPTGLDTTVVSATQPIHGAIDLVSGEPVAHSGRECPIHIEPGAFRILKIELARNE